MDRSLLAGIGASVALAAGCATIVALPASHPADSHDRPARASVAAHQVVLPRSASPAPSPSKARPAPAPRSTQQAPSPAVPQPKPLRSRQPSPTPAPQPKSRRVFVGVAVKGSIVPSVRSFSRATDAKMAMVEMYTRFGAPLPARELYQVSSTGARPLMQWNPRGSAVTGIAAGGYSSYLRKYAESVKRFRHPIVMSFGHEMNGTWNSWGAAHVRPSVFVAAWRRIHNIFAAAGVHNVTWSWDPSHVGDLPKPWWPGARYVGMIGIDGYQRPGDTFARIFAARLAYIRHFTRKPIYIAETGVAPSRGQVRQIVGLFYGVQRYHLRGFVYFDVNHLEAWRLQGRRSALRAFRQQVARTRR